MMIAAFTIAFIAALIRGFSGFGYAVLVVLGLNLLMPAQQAIATAIFLDLVCCLSLIPRALHDYHRVLLKELLLGMVLMLPVGMWAVNFLPAPLMSLIVGSVSLLGGVLLWLNIPLRKLHHQFAIPAGMASGLAMTTASAGGPPMMVYLLNQPIPSIQKRSTAILFFAVCSGCTCIGLAFSGLINGNTLHWGGLMLLPSLLGNYCGQKSFQQWGHLPFQRGIAPLLILMSLWVILRHW
jgi:uncharacterized membrane protein YfcA